MIIFHGSENIIEKPIHGHGNAKNDYGFGFYCTRSEELAKEWACQHDTDGYANEYEFDISGLDTLDLCDGSYNILNWLAILLDNRTFRIDNPLAQQAKDYIESVFMPDYKNRDVIIGYRADDSYFSFANAFLNNAIPLESLEKAMFLGRLGIQIVPKSEIAFSRLQYVDSHIAECAVYGPRYAERDSAARAAFRDEQRATHTVEAVYMIDILRERWQNNHEGLRRIISR